MKRAYVAGVLTLFLMLCFFLVACNEVNYNAQIKNNTNESVVLAVTINGTDRIITLNPDQSFDITNVADKITSVKVVKDAGHADITDNRYVVLAGRAMRKSLGKTVFAVYY
jgi:hypothetical protein